MAIGSRYFVIDRVGASHARIAAYSSLFITLVLLVIPGSVIDWFRLWAYQWWPWASSSLALSAISNDKFIHAAMFAVCGALVAKGWVGQLARWRWMFLILIGYGMLTEFLQLFVPGRVASVGDLFADFGGAGVGIFWAYQYFKSNSE